MWATQQPAGRTSRGVAEKQRKDKGNRERVPLYIWWS